MLNLLFFIFLIPTPLPDFVLDQAHVHERERLRETQKKIRQTYKQIYEP